MIFFAFLLAGQAGLPTGPFIVTLVFMKILATLLIALIALEHVGFLALEMFFWDHPIGRERFDLTPEFSAQSAVLAANQGLYNGFLAAGLFWGLVARKTDVIIFFLLCVLVAGIYGGMTVKPSIFYIQAAPAALALLATMFGLARK